MPTYLTVLLCLRLNPTPNPKSISMLMPAAGLSPRAKNAMDVLGVGQFVADLWYGTGIDRGATHNERQEIEIAAKLSWGYQR